MINKTPVKHLTGQEVNKILQHIKRIDEILSFDVTLNSKDILSIKKLGKKSLDFTENALVYAREYPHFMPSYISIEDFSKNLELMKDLIRISSHVRILTENIKSMSIVAGSEAFRAGRAFYNAIKHASKNSDSSLDVVKKNLEKLFERKGKPGEEEVPL